MTLREDFKVLVSSIRQAGLFPTLAAIPRYLREVSDERRDAFDRTFGTRTNERTMGSRDNRGHWPTPANVFAEIMARLPIRHEEFVFIDIGSGLGRAVLLASNHPFKKIIGIELDPALVEISRENVAIYRSDRQRCHAFEVCLADATHFEIPDGPLVFYLYQPFTKPLLEKLLANIEAAWMRAPRPMFIVDYNPWPDDPLDKASFLERIAQGTNAGAYRMSWTIHASRSSR